VTRPLAHELSDRIGAIAALDGPAGAIGRTVRRLLPGGPVKDLLSGVPIGHALHPLLSDVPIGTWTSATIPTSSAARPRARRRCGSSASGCSPPRRPRPMGDDAVRRVGIVHAISNGSAAVLYGASLLARRRGAHRTGVLLDLAGAGAVGAGGGLGGDFVLARGIGVDQTTFHAFPEDWTPVLDASMLGDDRPAAAVAGDVPILVVRRDGVLHALADRCSHRGAPLHEGELVADCIECPWHQSRFRLADGAVQQGPAAYPQPVLDVREHQGRIEVRAAS